MESQEGIAPRPDYRRWLRGVLILIAALVVARFILEAANVSPQRTALFSSSLAVFIGAIYLGAVAPLRGVQKYRQMLVPALVVAAWFGAWNGLALIVSAVFHVTGSHFATVPGLEHWQHLGLHILGHFGGVTIFTFPIVFGLMALLFFLRRWPLVVGPAAILGALVTLRFGAEALKLDQMVSLALSSTVGVLLAAIYLGGAAPRAGLVSARQLLVPALVLGWTWRFWVFLATLFSALPGSHTHFFDRTGGNVAMRLLGDFGGSFVLAGFVFGLILWIIAVWTSRVARLSAAG